MNRCLYAKAESVKIAAVAVTSELQKASVVMVMKVSQYICRGLSANMRAFG